MDRVAELVEKTKRQINHIRPSQPELIVDATGVGVVEMFKDRGLKYRAVSITGGSPSRAREALTTSPSATS